MDTWIAVYAEPNYDSKTIGYVNTTDIAFAIAGAAVVGLSDAEAHRAARPAHTGPDAASAASNPRARNPRQD